MVKLGIGVDGLQTGYSECEMERANKHYKNLAGVDLSPRIWDHSSAVECLRYKQAVTGSNPVGPIAPTSCRRALMQM